MQNLQLTQTYLIIIFSMLQENGTDRPGSSLSAHERLFGAAASRETSMSPPMSPNKKVTSGGGSGPSSSEHSAMASPIFKSAAAKAIIEEVGKTPRPSAFVQKRAERRDKKRSFTITSSQPAVTEALNEHRAKMVSKLICWVHLMYYLIHTLSSRCDMIHYWNSVF